MSAFVRAMLMDGGFGRQSRQGDGLLAALASSGYSADSNQTFTVANMAGGLVTRAAGATAGRTDTSDTAANILAANPSMDIGDSFTVVYSNQSTQSITLAGGTGVTASGNLVVLTLTPKFLVFTKTSATTMTMQAL